MGKIIVLSLSAIMLAACAWQPIGTPTESSYAATNECAAQTRSDAGAATMVAAFPFGALGGAIAGAVTDGGGASAFDDCMRAKGWQER